MTNLAHSITFSESPDEQENIERLFGKTKTTKAEKIEKYKTNLLAQIYFSENKIHAENTEQMLFHIKQTHLDDKNMVLFYIPPVDLDKYLDDKFTDEEMENLKRSKQWSFKLDDLTNFRLTKLIKLSKDQNVNIYISQNNFLLTGSRKKVNAYSSQCMIVDIDYYKVDSMKTLTADEAYYRILDSGILEGIEPHYAISSGKGLSLIYLLNNVPLYKKDKLQMLWDKVLNQLIIILVKFGADIRAKGICRVNRLPLTINTKNGKEAYIIDFDTVKSKTFMRYNLFDLAKKTLPYTYEQVLEFRKKQQENIKKAEELKQNKLSKKENKACQKQIKQARVYQMHNAFTLNQAKIHDLEKLIEIRNYDLIGSRSNLLLFLGLSYVYSYANSNDYDIQSTIAHLENLNSSFIEPLSMNEFRNLNTSIKYCYNNLISLCSGVITNKTFDKKGNEGIYTPTHKYIIEELNITDEEMRLGNFQTIISENIKTERKKTKDKAKKKKKRRNENGLTSKQQAKQDKLNQIKKLLPKKMTLNEMAKIIGISKRVLILYKKEIEL